MGRRPRDEDPITNRLLELRTDRDITRHDLADAVGVHYQTIGYLERGEYSPSLVLALRIARVLDLPVESLFSLDPLPETQADEPPAS
jgi:DNA-binding XRE family transcriptional regulator